jgi:hypothetical protein
LILQIDEQRAQLHEARKLRDETREEMTRWQQVTLLFSDKKKLINQLNKNLIPNKYFHTFRRGHVNAVK